MTETTTSMANAADEATGRSFPTEATSSSSHSESFHGNDKCDNNYIDMHPSSLSPPSSLEKCSNDVLSNNNNDHAATAVVASSAMLSANDTIGGSDDTGIADANEKIIIRHPSSSSTTTSMPSTHHPVTLPSKNQQPQTMHSQQLLYPKQTFVDETKIHKAISFLHNPTIRDVSNSDKRVYLRQQTDLNAEEIDTALNRIRVMEGSVDVDGDSSRGVVTDGNVRDGIDYDFTATGDKGRRVGQQQDDQWQGKQQKYDDRFSHHHQQQQQQQQPFRRGNPPLHGGGRPYPPSPSQPLVTQSQDDDDEKYNDNWQSTRGYYDPHYRENGSSNYPYDNHHHHHHQRHHRGWEGDGGGEVSTAAAAGGGGTSWVGGFSLGILGLAAWRWLNGGDFVLFPPPSVVMSTTTGTTTPRSSLTNNDRKSAAATKEENESMKNVSWKDLPSCPEDVEERNEDGYEDEEQEEENVEENEESDEESDDANEVEYDDEEEVHESHCLHEILNHANSNKNTRNRYHSHSPNPSPDEYHHHQQQQPSYNELVLEIRALTSAIHSHRDSQERIARNAYNSNVGKNMTDDAMDFLRKKKEENSSVVDVSKQEKISVVASLLKEVSGDLCQLKQSMNSNSREGREEGSITKAGATEKRTKEEGNNEEIARDLESPVKQIDVVIEKIQKMMTIVDEKQEGVEKGNFAALERGSTNSSEDGDVRGHVGTATEEGEDNRNSASNISSVDRMSPLVVPLESVASDQVANAAKVRESEVQELREQQNDNDASLATPETFQINTDTPHQKHEDQPQEQHQQNQLEDALRILATRNDGQKLKVGAQMLYLYCRNISQDSSVPRYRRIYTNNSTFRNKVGNLVGAREFLTAIGFVEHAKENLFEWSDPVGGGDTEATIKSKLDFALVALELMKKGAGGDLNGSDCKDAK